MNYGIMCNENQRILYAVKAKYALHEDYILTEILPEGKIQDYLYIDGEYIYSPLVIDTTIPDAQAEIATLKKQLSDTDYQAIKFAEGWLSEEEYAPIKAERQEWRDRINELELIIIEAKIVNS